MNAVTLVSGIEDLVRPFDNRPRALKVLKTESAHVVAFAFLAGQHLKEHHAFHPVIIQVVTGHCRFSWADQKADLRPGDLVHLPAMERHAVDAVEDSLLTVTMLVTAPGGEGATEVGQIPDAIE
ncbi:cupin domain-containing protein [Aestuariimicrobium ganziense]|uniref:cupin domain-containing protein n=1 Tax=Aestuariimicrobium ganziense TaxID=2773677 RepID=UPI0019423439|nr:cupin domain-containing protein [Aestuariimicrobium ganziense]